MSKSLMAVVVSLLVGIGIAGCDPFEKERKEQAERTRVECLDKACDGDVSPVPGPGDTVFKLNGQWHFAPTQYAKGLAGLAFYWPSKTPVTGRADGQSYPEQRQDYYDAAIEIFLSSSRADASTPSMRQTLLQLDSQGGVVSKRNLRPGLDVWRTRDGDINESWYIATQLQEPGGDPPVVACRGDDPKVARCTMGFRWKPDINASIRFRATHAADWPAIYFEATRILNLLKKHN